MVRTATPPVFEDRADAGRRLAAEFARRGDLVDAVVVVVGLARGGVPVAAEVAREIGAPLGVLAVRKVGHPLQPEFGLGAVTPGGGVYLRDSGDLSSEEIARAVARATEEVERKAARFAAVAPMPDPSGAVCVLVDDGLATGATMVAAARWARARGAARVLAAVPVASTEGADLLAGEVDAVICPFVTDAFWAVSVWYRRFDQVDDSIVESLLLTSDVRTNERDVTAYREEAVVVTTNTTRLPGLLSRPPGAQGVVVFAHGSGSSRHSPRNLYVAAELGRRGLSTLLMDLLTPEEEEADLHTAEFRFDIPLLSTRVVGAIDWLASEDAAAGVAVGLFGASTGAAAALIAAAARPGWVRAVVSRGGRPDLAMESLSQVEAPTLLIVGERDEAVITMNRGALARLGCEKKLAIVPGATHLFEEPGALEEVARLAGDWFTHHMGGQDGD